MLNKIYEFEYIDVNYNDNGDLVFRTIPGDECIFSPKQDIFLYNTLDKYNKMFVDFFIKDNEDNINLWKEWESDYSEFPYQFRDPY